MNTISRRHIGAQPTRHPGPAMPPNYRPPRWLESGGLETCAGIVIGGAIPPPLPAVTQDGTRIQAALLDPRTAARARRHADLLLALWAWLISIGIGVAAAMVQMP